MDSSSRNDPTLIRTTASLNEELERIFEQVETAVRKAGPIPEELLPGLEILPDDFDAPEAPAAPGGRAAVKPAPTPPPPGRGTRPGRLKFAAEEEPAREILSGDFDLAVGRISPADDYGDDPLARDAGDFNLAAARISPAGHGEPEMPGPDLDGRPPARPLRLEAGAFRLSGAEAETIAEAASALAPDELARLIERAVEKGVLTALKKWGR